MKAQLLRRPCDRTALDFFLFLFRPTNLEISHPINFLLSVLLRIRQRWRWSLKNLQLKGFGCSLTELLSERVFYAHHGLNLICWFPYLVSIEQCFNVCTFVPASLISCGRNFRWPALVWVPLTLWHPLYFFQIDFKYTGMINVNMFQMFHIDFKYTATPVSIRQNIYFIKNIKLVFIFIPSVVWC